MSSTLSEGVRVPDIGSTSWGADVNFNWGLLNTALANISGNVKTDVANTWTAPQTFTETISGSIDGVATRAVGDEDGNNIKTAIATKAADNSVVHLAGAETITGNKTWTGINKFTNPVRAVTNQSVPIAENPSAEIAGNNFKFIDNDRFWGQFIPVWSTDGSFRIELGISNWTTTGNQGYWTVGTEISKDFSTLSFYTSHLNANLGTANNRWLTLNGINPGALGLPNFNAGITLDTTNWDKTGEYGVSANFWTPTVNGWLTVLVNGTPGSGWVQLSQADSLGQFSICLNTGYAWATIPVVANWQCKIALLCSTVSAKFYPCLGNV